VARLRKVEIYNFRCIERLIWFPEPGINCLIGPGDSGKTTILDAIDLCLGARRTVQFTDADFHNLDVSRAISITLTIGDLDDRLKNLETYGLYLRGFNEETGVIEDEPEKGLESVLCLNLSVGSDLEPVWTLISDRAQAQSAARNLAWSDRVQLAPTRIGALAEYNLGWRRGSVLNRLTDEKPDASAALAKAARDARAAFGHGADEQLADTLQIVTEQAKELGIPVGEKVQALLDAHSVTFSGGMISLHDEVGVPLRGLGVGSLRLLIAGLQRRAADRSSILLVDELEHGLEPHRIIRFLSYLGAKEESPPLQVFMTTHSPVALRELSGDQLFVVRRKRRRHQVMAVGSDDDVQSTIRLYPDAFLATRIVLCEGASEVGLIRGLDQYFVNNEMESVFAAGVALVDCGGGAPDKLFQRANAFHRLGYRVAILRDDDQKPTPAVEEEFKSNGGHVFSWRKDRALEDELFLSLPPPAIKRLLRRASYLHSSEDIDQHIRSKSNGELTLDNVINELKTSELSLSTRAILGKAARTKRSGWFKSVTWMEVVARLIVGPNLDNSDSDFRAIITNIFSWMRNADPVRS